MRDVADRNRIDAFLEALAREAYGEVDAAMISRGLTSAAQIRAQFAQMEPVLHRFPAIDPGSFRRAMEAALA